MEKSAKDIERDEELESLYREIEEVKASYVAECEKRGLTPFDNIRVGDWIAGDLKQKLGGDIKARDSKQSADLKCSLEDSEDLSQSSKVELQLVNDVPRTFIFVLTLVIISTLPFPDCAPGARALQVVLFFIAVLSFVICEMEPKDHQDRFNETLD